VYKITAASRTPD